MARCFPAQLPASLVVEHNASEVAVGQTRHYFVADLFQPDAANHGVGDLQQLSQMVALLGELAVQLARTLEVHRVDCRRRLSRRALNEASLLLAKRTDLRGREMQNSKPALGGGERYRAIRLQVLVTAQLGIARPAVRELRDAAGKRRYVLQTR